MPPTAPIGSQWDQDFLKDISAPDNQANVNYLNAWQQREGASGFANNPLATMEGGYGGTPGTNGIMSYPSVQQGAAADAAALSNGQYGQLLQAFQKGDPSLGGTYGGELSKWSGGGYGNLSGMGGAGGIGAVATNVGNSAGVTGLNQQQGLTDFNIANSSLLAGQNAQYAQQETGYQQQLLGLSNQQLGIQLGTLGRAEKLDPALYKLQQQQFGLQGQSLTNQRADIERQGKTNITGTQSGEAASNSLFTSGGRTNLSNVRADLKSSLASNTLSQRGLGIQEQQAGLNYKEQMAALQDQAKNLGITSQRYGISQQELNARLQNSLQNINEGNISTILGYQQEGLSNEMQLAQLLGGGLPLSSVIGGTPSQTTVPTGSGNVG